MLINNVNNNGVINQYSASNNVNMSISISANGKAAAQLNIRNAIS
jgi:hypothetical protein